MCDMVTQHIYSWGSGKKCRVRGFPIRLMDLRSESSVSSGPPNSILVDKVEGRALSDDGDADGFPRAQDWRKAHGHRTKERDYKMDGVLIPRMLMGLPQSVPW